MDKEKDIMQDTLKEDLRGIGCPDGIIDQLELAEGNSRRLMILNSYRKKLLGDVHREQQRLQDLDYLIFRLRTGEE